MKNSEFYIQDFKYLIGEDFDISFIPLMIRRKLSSVDKYAIKTLSHFQDKQFDELIYSSRYGELERLFKLIDQYLDDNEVSPNLFSCSVHNYLIGLYSQLNKITNSYTALSAENNSFSMGLLKSIISNKENKLYCYVNKDDTIIKAISCIFSNTSGNIKCRLQKTNSAQTINEFNSFKDFLDNKIQKINFNCYSIERIN